MIDTQSKIRVDVRLYNALTTGTLPKQLLIDSGAGTGKTFSILKMLHILACDYPDLRILVCRQTRRSLTESVLVTYEKEILPADGMEHLAYGASRRNRASYDYPNGSTIVPGGLDRPDKILSTAWDVIYLNEAIQAASEAWDALWERLNRPGSMPGFGFLLGDTNPGDPSHWLKKRCDAGEIARWQARHEANPSMFDGKQWTREGELYLASLKRLKGTRRKRFLEGIWAAGEGQWFETFGDQHSRDEAEYNPAYPVHLAVDSGVHTGAVWFQVRPTRDGDKITVFGDYYGFNVAAYEAALQIRSKGESLGIRKIDRGVTDPAGKASTAVGPTVLGEYERAGLRLDSWPSYPGSVLDGLSLIESFVSVDPPSLIVHPRCQATIEAFANYKRAKRSGQFIDRPEDPQHPFEDVMDALRGGLQDKYPEGRKLPPLMRRTSARNVF